MPFLRKYATGTGADVYLTMVKRAVVDHAVSADWTPAAGDVKISIDGGAAANIGTLPTAVAMGNSAEWKFVFTDAELTGKRIVVTIADSATKAVEDSGFAIETFGHASAMFAVDFSDATRFGPAALPDAPPDAAGGLIISDAGGLDIDAVGAAVTSGTHGNAALKTLVDAIGVDVDAALAAVDTEIASLTTEVGKIPKSDGTASWNATALAAINAEADTALSDYDGPTNAELTTALGTLNDITAADVWAAATRTLTALGFDLADTDFAVGAFDGVWSRGIESISGGATAIINRLYSLPVNVTPGTTGGLALDDDVVAILEDTGTTLPATLSTIAGYLDTEIAAILAAVDTEIAAILEDTGTTIPATLSGLFTTALTESYRADGATGSVAQILYELIGHHNESDITSVTKTVKKIDGSTTAFTLTLNDATTPTAITRAT